MMASTDIAVRVPVSLNYQLVYRLETAHPFQLVARPELQLHWIDKPQAVLPLAGEIRRLLGPACLLRLTLKLTTSSRHFYTVVKDGRIVHTGWVTLGWCRHYWIEEDAVVIGPIWTAQEVRGQRIGSYALQWALNRLEELGRRRFYIDTSKANIPCQKLIAHCSFGPPVAVLLRAPEREE